MKKYIQYISLKKILIIIIITLGVLGILFFVMRTPAELRASYDEVILSQSQEDTILIDLRTEKELRQTGIIPGAIHIDYYKNDFKQKLSELDPSKKYIVYCHVGVRSNRVFNIMSDLGFIDVSDYTPGIKGWLEMDGPTLTYE